MSDFEEKFKHLNFNYNEGKDEGRYRQNNYQNNTNSNSRNNINSNEILKELINTISQNLRQDRMFVLILINMLKNKNASNELILALLYIFI